MASPISSSGKHSSSHWSDAMSCRRHTRGTFRFASMPQGGGQGNLLRRGSSSKLLRAALASGRRPSSSTALCLAADNGGGNRELSYSQPHTSNRDTKGAARAAGTMPHSQLLDRFWRARGVMEDSLRKELVDTGLSGIREGGGGDAADAEAIQEDKSWVVATSEAGDSQVRGLLHASAGGCGAAVAMGNVLLLMMMMMRRRMEDDGDDGDDDDGDDDDGDNDEDEDEDDDDNDDDKQ